MDLSEQEADKEEDGVSDLSSRGKIGKLEKRKKKKETRPVITRPVIIERVKFHLYFPDISRLFSRYIKGLAEISPRYFL